MMVWSEGRRPRTVASSQATAPLARTPAARADVRRRSGLRGVPRARSGGVDGLAPSARDAAGERVHGARRLRRRDASTTPASRRVLPARREVSWRAPTAPTARFTTTRSRTPSASRRCSSTWSRSPAGAPGARDRVGQPAGARGRPALVPSASRTSDHQPRSAALDRRDRELELHVRRLPLHQRAQGATTRRPRRYATQLRGGVGLVRGLPRPGLASRRVGAPAARAAQRAPRQRAADRARRARGRFLDARSRQRQAARGARARQSEREIEMCARCHSRRGLIHEDHVHGQPVGDDYRVALLDDDLYYPDGQIKGEVYEYGSFIQSRMYAEGVTCSDCHDPHRPELRAPGATTSACSATPRRPTPRRAPLPRRRHRRARAAWAVTCRRRTFMVVDPRRDHSLRVPRPDLSVKLGVPNACNGCHADRHGAAGPRARSSGGTATRRRASSSFAEALAAGAQGRARRAAPARGAGGRSHAASHRSSQALSRLARGQTSAGPMAPRSRPRARRLSDPSPLVRRAAVSVLRRASILRVRAPLLAPLLADPVRSVRIEAVPGMAGLPADALSPADRVAPRSSQRGARRGPGAERRPAGGAPQPREPRDPSSSDSTRPKPSCDLRWRSIRRSRPPP